MIQTPTTGIVVNNAGLVILQTYFPMLFMRAGLTTDHQFTDPASRENAARYLQFLATGETNTGDTLLALNKVLCGLSPDTALPVIKDLPVEHGTLMEGLLQSAISYWPAIGQSSVSGFRGNWLVRDGMLTEKTDQWELTVEKRAYDILLHRSPFSFSLIKYPWMSKPLHVHWMY